MDISIQLKILINKNLYDKKIIDYITFSNTNDMLLKNAKK